MTTATHAQPAAVRAVTRHKPDIAPVPLDRYFQSPPARRVEVNASFKPCFPADKMLRVINAKTYCERYSNL